MNLSSILGAALLIVAHDASPTVAFVPRALSRINPGLKISSLNYHQHAKTPQRTHTSLAAAQKGGGSNPNRFLVILESYMAGSNFMYAFTSLRQAVIANEQLDNDDPNKVKLERTELILTQNGQSFISDKRDVHRYLKYEVTGDAIRKFISFDVNREFMDALPDDKVNTKEGDIDNFIDVQNKLAPINFGIVEFDDQFSDKELVYSITVNRTHKRVTVFFRGSVWGTRDWPTNFNAFPKTIPTPTNIKEEDLDEEIKVHRGFHSYLSERLDRETALPLPILRRIRDFFWKEDKSKITTKIAQIRSNLREVFNEDEFKDYTLYCTGHSLGGALSQLLAFELAGDKKFLQNFPNAFPVTAITYASPNVGDDGFRKAYQVLEKDGLLRHVRVSNAGDVVPVSPPLFGYTQTGVNMFVSSESREMEVGYRNTKSFGETVGYAFKNRSGLFKVPDDMGKYHSLPDYYDNLVTYQNKETYLWDKDVQALYDEYAGDFVA